jgi:CTP synthase (UTP-ammonia lyase)
VKRAIRVGIIGDYDASKTSHPATYDSIRHAASYLSIEAAVTWLPTPSLLTEKGQKSLVDFDCLWASSGSPYQSTDGMLIGIKKARELDIPFIGT